MKMLNYNELILERLILGINESIIYYSPPLKDILYKIAKKENEIAKELVDLEGTDVKPDVTYLDIDKEGFLSFITMKNVEKKLKDKGIHIATIDKIVKGDTSLTEPLYNNDYTYGIFSKSRNPIKLGKLLNQVLKGSYTDKEKEEFVNLFKAKSSGEGEKFELVEGSEIPFWYNKKNYAEEKGQLGGSCMRGGYDNYFKIYADHPEICKMLILKDDEDKLLGRALIWKIKDKNKNLEFEYFMDRQYTIKESDVKKFREYADSQGWAYKTNNSHSSYYGVTYKGENHSITM
jgi:hypothetical protein